MTSDQCDVAGLPPVAGGGGNTQSPASPPSDQQREHPAGLPLLPLPLTEARQDIPDLEDRKPREFHSPEPPDNPEETGIEAGGGLGEDPDGPALPTHQGQLLLSALRLNGESDGGQRGERPQ